MNNTTLRLCALPIAEEIARECFWLECDGMAGLIHYHLSRAKLPVVHHRGIVQFSNSYPVTHDWGTLGCWTIDYRLRIWYPDQPREQVPEGIFKASRFAVRYDTQVLLTSISSSVAAELSRRRPAPDWSVFAEVFRRRHEGLPIPQTLRDAIELEMKRAPALVGPDNDGQKIISWS